jgi:hypothetical protein
MWQCFLFICIDVAKPLGNICGGGARFEAPGDFRRMCSSIQVMMETGLFLHAQQTSLRLVMYNAAPCTVKKHSQTGLAHCQPGLQPKFAHYWAPCAIYFADSQL